MQENKFVQKLTIKLFLSLLYFIIIGILLVTAYYLYLDDKKIDSFNNAKTTTDYSKINISKMSEKIAYYKDKDIGIHYVIEYENSGVWHTYLVAINESEIKRFKQIIDYTYGKTKDIPKTITVYGYPVLINNELKEIAIKHIKEFVPESNEVEITKDNFSDYLTNSYLDTTKEQVKSFNYLLLLTLLLILFMIFLMIYTLCNNTKLVKSIDHTIERNKKRIKRIKSKFRKR